MENTPVDALAEQALQIKEGIRTLREELWKIEQEIGNRLIKLNAKVMEGGEYRVRSSVKRTLVFDQEKLAAAFSIAAGEGLGNLFNRAFTVERKVSLRGLDELTKRGGKTKEAIDAAQLEAQEKTNLVFEKL